MTDAGTTEHLELDYFNFANSSLLRVGKTEATRLELDVAYDGGAGTDLTVGSVVTIQHGGMEALLATVVVPQSFCQRLPGILVCTVGLTVAPCIIG